MAKNKKSGTPGKTAQKSNAKAQKAQAKVAAKNNSKGSAAKEGVKTNLKTQAKGAIKAGAISGLRSRDQSKISAKQGKANGNTEANSKSSIITSPKAKAPKGNASNAPETKTLKGKGVQVELEEIEIEEVVEIDQEYFEEDDVDSEVTAAMAGSDEIILTDAEGRRLCRVRDCDQAATVDSYCRFHYLLLWKKIQVRKKIITDGKLERYVEELTSRYPDKFLEMIKKDLRSEKEFHAAIAELEIDEAGLESEFEDDNYMDDVRGVSSGEGSASLAEDEDF